MANKIFDKFFFKNGFIYKISIHIKDISIRGVFSNFLVKTKNTNRNKKMRQKTFKVFFYFIYPLFLLYLTKRQQLSSTSEIPN